jgi:hypothetical protein
MDIEEKYKKLLESINLIEPPKGLERQILARINMEKKRLAKIRTFIFGGSAIASFGFSLWAIIYLVKSVQETGFWQYLSLIFSENRIVLVYWRELSFSLVESLPIVSLMVFLTAVGFFIWSLANMLKKETRLFNMSFNQPI